MAAHYVGLLTSSLVGTSFQALYKKATAVVIMKTNTAGEPDSV